MRLFKLALWDCRWVFAGYAATLFVGYSILFWMS